MTKTETDAVLEFLRSFIAGGSQQDFKPWASELYQKLYRASDEPEAPLPDMAHLDAVQLRRILDRHIRWREKALTLLKEAANLERKPTDLARLIEFIDQSETRLVLAENRRAEP